MTRPADSLTLEGPYGELTKVERIEIDRSITESIDEATVTIGDDASWLDIIPGVRPGAKSSVRINGRPAFTGRVEVAELDADVSSGFKIDLTVRSRLTDAKIAAADPKVRLSGASLRDFIVELFKPIGYAAGDFTFDAYADADVLSGVRPGGGKRYADLVPIQPAQAKVNPGDSIIETAKKHLDRHGLALWPSPDGKIIVAVPNVDQPPRYKLRARRDNAQFNNVKKVRCGFDFSEVPTEVWVYGATYGADLAKVSMRGVATNDGPFANLDGPDVVPFKRKAIQVQNDVKDRDQASARAEAMLSMARRREDFVEVTVDGLSYWDGQSAIPWAVNATAELDFDLAESGLYYVHAMRQSGSVRDGFTTTLAAVRANAWRTIPATRKSASVAASPDWSLVIKTAGARFAEAAQFFTGEKK